jgi:DNA helicase IV
MLITMEIELQRFEKCFNLTCYRSMKNEEKNLTAEQQEMVAVETATLKSVLTSLEAQRDQKLERITRESGRARELTASLVNTRRAEDKQLLASDEAVSHALKDKFKLDDEVLTKLIKKPYFARIVLEDESNGDIKELEYKIGAFANPDCRIIDWRKAPISKLYYQYREGEEYSEEIQGMERIGTVALRNRLEISNSQLVSIGCRYGTLSRDGERWLLSATPKARNEKGTYGRLPSIVSLIDPEQFRLITEEAATPVLIQGVAGSGKTAVALHRLSWLLHEGNSDLKINDAIIIVRSPVLKRYIEASLPLLELEEVPVRTHDEWRASPPKRLYRAVVIDEVQDFSEVELKSILQCTDSTRYLTLVGDSAQQVDEESSFPGWEKLLSFIPSPDGAGQLFTLEVSHRSTLQILNFARAVRNEPALSKGRSGRVPIWFKCSDERQGISTSIDWLKKGLAKYPHGLTAVLCRNLDQAKIAHLMLKPTFQNSIRLSHRDDFSLEDGLLVAPITDAKGLEFTNVLLWNPSKALFGKSEQERNLLYVGITRAEENVCIITWNVPSPFLPPLTSALIRGINLSYD